MRTAACVLVLFCIPGCGGDEAPVRSAATTAAEAPPAETQSPAADVLTLRCEDGFTPTRRFLGRRSWRRTSLELGAITMIDARGLRDAEIAGRSSYKLPLLVEPRAQVTLSFEPVPPLVAGFTKQMAANADPGGLARTVTVQGCPPVPADVREEPGVDGTGVALFVTVSGPGCLRVTASEKGGEFVEGTIPLGTRC